VKTGKHEGEGEEGAGSEDYSIFPVIALRSAAFNISNYTLTTVDMTEHYSVKLAWTN
jgi:hypothetical protein